MSINSIDSATASAAAWLAHNSSARLLLHSNSGVLHQRPVIELQKQSANTGARRAAVRTRCAHHSVRFWREQAGRLMPRERASEQQSWRRVAVCGAFGRGCRLAIYSTDGLVGAFRPSTALSTRPNWISMHSAAAAHHAGPRSSTLVQTSDTTPYYSQRRDGPSLRSSHSPPIATPSLLVSVCQPGRIRQSDYNTDGARRAGYSWAVRCEEL